MARIKITRKNGRIVYLNHTWPMETVTDDPADAFLFSSLVVAQEWIDRDGGSDCTIEEVD